MDKIVKFLLICFTFIILFGCSNKDKVNNKVIDEKIIDEEKEIITDENISSIDFSKKDSNTEPDSRADSLFNILYEIGQKIYDNEEYLKYSIIDEIYFISLNELNRDYSIDLSMFVDEDGMQCNYDKTGIYIDANEKFNIETTEDGFRQHVVPNFSGCLVLN